ncbi:uncharacterized protein J7T54_000050 [Emericellopsis cladophorae]|uniref:RNA polymerase I-specific transcription initiation factor rrn3 n=1 Tax=Emericellopsis cladophorae TaxID=2686198 RepID=A0A9P9XYC6_9HYPO|nr:uncharacterized protein J7T54_000050 [Emericellopsis cladophorae]KAI6780144.1 hypothetical protein J7T54_000050 [Emericellopsis cladophorae]
MRPFTPAKRTLGRPTPNSTPVKSILKPVSVLGRRTAEDAGIDEPSDAPSSPTKRRKVFFDESQTQFYEIGNRNMDEIKREVREALEEHRRGNDGPYDTLKDLFANDTRRYLPPVVGEEEDTLKPQELKNYVIALTSCMPLLKSKECNGLVKTIIKCSWLGRDNEFIKVYTYFLASLISAQGSYLLPVLSMMVEAFMTVRPSAWAVPDFPEIGRDTVRDRLHKTLRHLLQIFPAATSVLGHLLGAKFPFPNDSLKVHMSYVRNLLRVKDYAPELREEVLDLILNRVVKMDSQMMVDLEDLDDDLTAAVMYTLRDKPADPSQWEDDNLDDSDTESVDSDDSDYDEEAARIKSVKDNVEKMDAMLDTLFTYHTPLIERDPGSDEAYAAFTTILREFDTLVLPTYKSRHTQFLIFHFAQMHDRLSDGFCGQLMSIAFDKTFPAVLRQSCIAYLASFVARGAHVDRKTVQAIFDLLIEHMNNYRDHWEASCKGPDLKRFTTFYCLVQAAMYIFCFRWQDLVMLTPDYVDPEDPTSYIGADLGWPATNRRDFMSHIFGKFNPLKVCAPVIVEEFAKISHKLNFIYVYPLIETNKRLRLTQFMTSYATGGALRDAGYENGDESLHVLDPYFPFDPYQLPVSKRWLEGDYVHWRAVPGLNAEEEDEDSDEVDDMDDEESVDLEENTATDSEGDDDL